MMKLRGSVATAILAASTLGVALLAIAGIGFMQPTGEMSKLMYDKDLWCVSNFIEARTADNQPVLSKDGRPAKHELLKDGKEQWLVYDQVSAKSKAEAETKATKAGFFEPSNKDDLITALQKSDEAFFTSHFNTGATSPGPCLGTGSSTTQLGSWLSEKINKKCGLTTTADNTGTTAASNYEVVKTIEVKVTNYSPCLPNNTCDCQSRGNYAPNDPQGGNETSADMGTFVMHDGILQYLTRDKKTYHKYIYAEPATNNIIKWSDRFKLGIVIKGVNNDQPVFVHDHYASKNHANQNYLDIFSQCAGKKKLGNPMAGATKNSNGTYTATIVDTTKPISTTPANTASSTTASTSADKTGCPPKALAAGPTTGEDFRVKIAKALEAQVSKENPTTADTSAPATSTNSTAPESTDTSGPAYTGSYSQVPGIGTVANPGGKSARPSFNSCHGRSLCHPGYISGHNTINGYSTGDGDAIDIGTDGYAYAAFDGTAEFINGSKGGKTANLNGIKLKSNSGNIVLYYYHVNISKTGAVKAGDNIGTLIKLKSGAHIHLEATINGKVVHGDISKKSNGRAYVKSLWSNIKSALGI